MKTTLKTSFERAVMNTLVAFGTTLVILAMLECALRIAGLARTDWFANGPGDQAFTKKLKLNSFEFRGPYPASPYAATGTVRIITLGDSFAFGSGVPDDTKIFPVLLGKKLSAEGRRVEVMNVSRPGANTAKENYLFSEAQPVFHAQIVLLCYVPNDVEPVGGVPAMDKVVAPAIPLLPPSWRGHSYLLHFIDLRLRMFQESRGKRMSYPEYIHFLYKQPDLLKTNTDELARLDKAVRDSGAKLFIASLPLIAGNGPYPFTDATSYIRNNARALGAPFIDLEPILRAQGEEKMRISNYNAHFSPAGHAAAADALADFLEPAVSAIP